MSPTSVTPTHSPPPPQESAASGTPTVAAEIPKPVAAPLRAGAMRGYYVVHVLAALFPLGVACAVYGTRTIGTVLLVLAAATLATFCWRRIGMRGHALHYPHVLWLALLLGMLLPPHLLSDGVKGFFTLPPYAWTIPISGAFLLVLFLWLLGGVGYARFHPVLLVLLLLVIFYHDALRPRLILHRSHMLTGNLTDVGGELADSRATRDEPWIRWRETAANHSVFVKSPAAYSLSNYTRERTVEEGSRVAIENVIQDALPPLEDLVIAGHPGSIGSSSAIAVIVGGLFLVYRGIIDYRVPLLVVMAAFAALLVLPVPIVISDTGTQWEPLIMPRINQDLPVIITFINYEMLATPLLFMAFFLAGSPPVCPTSARARLVYATVVGILAAALQLYISAPFGAYLALGLGGMLTPWLDKVLRTKPIV